MPKPPAKAAIAKGARPLAGAVPGAEPLYREVRAVLEAARSSAYRAVNTAMVQAYWHVGRLIVEHEQGGNRRAAYGDTVLEDLSRRLTAEFGRGFDERNLRYMRQFYLAHPEDAMPAASIRADRKRNAVRSELGGPEKRNAARSELVVHGALRDETTTQALRFPATLQVNLSWTHFRLLLGVENPAARDWYMNEAVAQHWSTRQLERQISVLYYERLLASRSKAPVRKEAARKVATVEPAQFIRDPYVLEFLDLQDYPALRETALEQAIIENLQSFLLELGKGFCFVARQRRLRFENDDFYVDLVFYNYLLKCFVLIDLKVGKLTHQDIGQMDTYVRVFDAHARPDGDNPTIGLILASEKNEAVAKYSVLSGSKQIFAAKYVKVLPTETQLAEEIERERRLIDAGAARTPPGR